MKFVLQIHSHEKPQTLLIIKSACACASSKVPNNNNRMLNILDITIYQHSTWHTNDRSIIYSNNVILMILLEPNQVDIMQ